jgi:hypothetical protein
MKRRTFAFAAGASMVAGNSGRAFAQSAVPDTALLQTTLTPFGSERAGNAAGTIPAWTGGLTATPPGFESWDPNKELPPDFFASDAMLYEVNASNLTQYASLLSEGIQTLIKNTGFSVKVYPTHRTAAAPQWVYDFIVQNVGRARPEAGGIRMGFTGGYGGIPFPIPDSDPMVAGGQIIWNHHARWTGSWLELNSDSYTVPSGQVTLVNAERAVFVYPYYQQDGSLATFDGYFSKVGGPGSFAPSTVAGGQIISYDSTNPLQHPPIAWQLLAGQGRVRKAPEVLYDTPSSYANGIINYDEYYGFNGPTDRYDWKLLGKKEMLIPYNNNKIFHTTAIEGFQPKFFSPDATRWELHRVWEVEAVLHPGERNVLTRRRMYIDEDTWIVGVVDCWGADNDIQRTSTVFNANFPNLPGTIYKDTMCYNLQTGDYVNLQGSFKDAYTYVPWTFHPVPLSEFQPQAMAAAASY